MTVRWGLTAGGGGPGSDWVSGLEAEAADQVRQLVALAAEYDGVAALGGHVLENLQDGAGHYSLVYDTQLNLIAIGCYRDNDPAEVVVHPEHRRRGLGLLLVAGATRRAEAVWAHGGLPGAAAIAKKLDLVKSRELLQMHRPLSTWPEDPARRIDLPAGVRIRTFVVGRDEDQFLGVNARAFSWHPEQGRLNLDGLQSEMAQDWFDPAGFFLAVQGDRVLGFHWTKVHRDEKPPVGEVYALGVDPKSPVRGLGGPLTAAGLNYLAAARLESVMLYVEADNQPALTLYRRLGFQVTRSDVVFRVHR